MKSIKLILFFFSLSLSSFLNAQVVEDEIALIQSAFGMEKRAMIQEYMDLPNNSPFWSVYEAYEKERRDIMKERILIINEYLENFDNLTDVKADDLALRGIKNNAKLSALQSKHYKNFKKVISPIEAAKFMQIENYIQNTILLAVADELPFIGDN